MIRLTLKIRSTVGTRTNVCVKHYAINPFLSFLNSFKWVLGGNLFLNEQIRSKIKKSLIASLWVGIGLILIISSLSTNSDPFFGQKKNLQKQFPEGPKFALNESNRIKKNRFRSYTRTLGHTYITITRALSASHGVTKTVSKKCRWKVHQSALWLKFVSIVENAVPRSADFHGLFLVSELDRVKRERYQPPHLYPAKMWTSASGLFLQRIT